MKPQTCCCHICKTSLNQYKREYMACSRCNKIVCKNCFGTKHKAETWEEAFSSKPNWLCPSCQGTCNCPRCRKKTPTKISLSNSGLGIGSGLLTEDMKHTHSSKYNHLGTNGKENGFKNEEKDLPAKNEGENEILSNQSKSLPTLAPPPPHENGTSQNKRPSSSQGNVVEKLKPRVKKVVVAQLDDLIDREKRCEANIREMEKLMSIMRREKDEIVQERKKLGYMIKEVETPPREEETIDSPVVDDSIVYDELSD